MTDSNIDRRTVGAWLVHHTTKLQQVNNAVAFEEIEMAGKCGIFLSNLAASNEESDLNNDRIKAIAQISGIKRTELNTILDQLKQHELIDKSADGSVVVLGIVTSSVLTHSANIYYNSQPDSFQNAAICLSETVSDSPQSEHLLKESLADTFKLSKSSIEDLFKQSESIGLIDYESLGRQEEKIYFNGNLFRREDLNKTNKILSSLSQDETTKIIEMSDYLSKIGYVIKEDAVKILGVDLLERLQSVGLYDFNEVSNDQENKVFITKPAAFSKFGNPFEEDALDLAKAFVASLAYGMTISSSGRGKISYIKLLLRKLINGLEVGPASAIGQDYKLLELRRVVSLRYAHGDMFYMRLLKRDIGEIALQVLEQGDASSQSLQRFTTNISRYKGPEANRYITRKNQTPDSKKNLSNLLRTFRT